ncbi:hypothetical protein K1719_037515 [Acacia pycnantha]|nr:hypothetical protein K1719_037515 [Acacia pycnantha]
MSQPKWQESMRTEMVVDLLAPYQRSKERLGCLVVPRQEDHKMLVIDFDTPQGPQPMEGGYLCSQKGTMLIICLCIWILRIHQHCEMGVVYMLSSA